MIIQVVVGAECVDAKVIQDGATLSGATATWTGGSWTAPETDATLMSQDGAGIGWELVNGVLVPPAAPAQTQAQLSSAVDAACSTAANAVLGQIYTDTVHQAAGQNAAMIAAIAGGAPTSTSPFYAQFNAYAALFGITPAALATLAEALTNQSLALSSALTTLENAVTAATTAAALATALAAFETAIAAVVAAVNAASPPSPLLAPAAITIAGVNA